MRIIAALRERDAEKAIRELRVHMAASYAWVMPCSRLSGNRLPPSRPNRRRQLGLSQRAREPADRRRLLSPLLPPAEI
jgi:hypothetical protein